MEVQGKLPYHRKYRVSSLEQMVGNESLKKTLTQVLKQEQKPQLLLFYGSAGCGKTSSARIVAKEVSCSHPTEHGACGECESCKAFDEYIETGDETALLNVTERHCSKINKEESDKLIAEMQTPTLYGDYKVYILDEAHLLTVAAMGNLLKIFEEPPEGVIIILCTTNPDQLLDTIYSRCQYRLQVTKPTRAEMCKLLAMVCEKEQVEYNIKALSLIARKGDYAPRECLTWLEAVVTEKGKVDYESTVEVLQVVSDRYYAKFFSIMLDNEGVVDPYRYLQFLVEVKANLALDNFVLGLRDYLMRGQEVYFGQVTDGVDISEVKEFKNIFSRVTFEDLAYLMKLVKQLMISRDKEYDLQALAFTGIRAPKVVQRGMEDLNIRQSIDNINVEKIDKGVIDEKIVSSETYNSRKYLTSGEEQEMISQAKRVISSHELIDIFDGAKVECNLEDFD